MTNSTYTDDQIETAIMGATFPNRLAEMLAYVYADRQRLQADCITYWNHVAELQEKVAVLRAEVGAYQSALREFQDARRYSNLHTRQVARDIEQRARATPNETKEAKS